LLTAALPAEGFGRRRVSSVRMAPLLWEWMRGQEPDLIVVPDVTVFQSDALGAGRLR